MGHVTLRARRAGPAIQGFPLSSHVDFEDEAPSNVAPTTLFGRFMLPDSSEFPCQVVNITTEGATFVTNDVPPVGLDIVAYLEELGRIEARSAGAAPNGFHVTYTMTGARLERLHARIKWLENKRNGNGSENRRHQRYEPRESSSQITLPDGRVYQCEVIDISVSGAGLKVDVMPAMGTYLMLGKMRGRVVRYIENGIAIEFARQLDAQQLQTQLAS